MSYLEQLWSADDVDGRRSMLLGCSLFGAAVRGSWFVGKRTSLTDSAAVEVAVVSGPRATWCQFDTRHAFSVRISEIGADDINK